MITMRYVQAWRPSVGKGVPTGLLGKRQLPRKSSCNFVQVEREPDVNR